MQVHDRARTGDTTPNGPPQSLPAGPELSGRYVHTAPSLAEASMFQRREATYTCAHQHMARGGRACRRGCCMHIGMYSWVVRRGQVGSRLYVHTVHTVHCTRSAITGGCLAGKGGGGGVSVQVPVYVVCTPVASTWAAVAAAVRHRFRGGPRQPMASPRAISSRGSGGLALLGSLARKWPLLSSPPLSSALPPHLLLQQTLLLTDPSSASPARQAFSIASLLLPASRDSISHSFSPPVARVLFFCFDVQVSSLLSWRQLLDQSLLLPACRSTFLSVKIIPLQLLNASLSLHLAPSSPTLHPTPPFEDKVTTASRHEADLL